MHVCMYACMHVCMYACMFVCLSVCTLYVYIYIYTGYFFPQQKCRAVPSSKAQAMGLPVGRVATLLWKLLILATRNGQERITNRK